MGVLLQATFKFPNGHTVPSPFDGNRRVPWWWDHLASQAHALRQAGFTAVLLPPALKTNAGAFPGADGYGPFDDYDLGNKDQFFSTPTRFGSRERLQRCTAIMRANGLDVYLDLVPHHRNGGNNFTYTYRGANGSAGTGRFPKQPKNFFPHVPRDPIAGPIRDDFGFGDELAPVNAQPHNYVMDGLIDAGDWQTKALDAQGYRIDDTKGLAVAFVKNFLNSKAMRGKFAVGEYFDGNPDTLNWWVSNSGMDGRASTFDFGIRFALAAMCDHAGGWDMAQLDHAGFAGRDPAHAVTFIENHDTDLNFPAISNKMLAYAYLLTSEGYPCVFYKDYSPDAGCYGLKPLIDNLVWIHENLANGQTVFRHKEFQYVVYERTSAPNLLVGLNNDPFNGWKTVHVATGFGSNTLLHDYSGHSGDVWTDGGGNVTIGIPPNHHGLGYVCYSRAGLDRANLVHRHACTQVFEGAEDLDIGPAIPGDLVRIGRIWCEAATNLDAHSESNADGLTFGVQDPSGNPLALTGWTRTYSETRLAYVDGGFPIRRFETLQTACNLHKHGMALEVRMIRRTLTFALLALPVFAQVDVLTRRNDNSRNAVNSRETILNQSNVRTKFGKLWTLYADAKIMAQPLYVSNLRVPAANVVGTVAKTKCPSGCNTVIFATMKGTFYAYLADEKPTTQNDTLLWATYLSDGNACQCNATGPQNGSGDFDMWAVDDPWWGVLSTPVIDRAHNAIYAVSWTNDKQYRVYNLNLKTGKIQKGPVVVQGSIGNQTFSKDSANWKQLRKQRAGLLLSNGLLYVGFGGDNHESLAGWLFVYDANTLALKTVWSPTPNGRNGGIWMSGEAPAADNAGNVFLQTGDGDVNPQEKSFGDSLVKLHFDNGAIQVADSFSPCNQIQLSKCDLDHGSSGPILFDGSVLGGGKNGELYLMRADHLAGFTPGPFPPPALMCDPGIPDCQDSAKLTQKWQATSGHIHGAPVFWNGPGGKSWLYVMGEADHLKAFPFTGGKFVTVAAKQSKFTQPHMANVPECQSNVHHWMPGGLLSVSSNQSQTGTGIVWALSPANGDANSCRGVKGVLLALNAEDVTKEIWRSQGPDPALADNKDSFGLLARFNPPTVANGKVFVPTAGDKEQLRRWGGQRPALVLKTMALSFMG